MTMTNNEIREALDNMTVSTARSRALATGQAVDLGPGPYEVEMATKNRADGYLGIYRQLAELVQAQSAGIGADEVEAVEWIREHMLTMARNVYIDYVMRG